MKLNMLKGNKILYKLNTNIKIALVCFFAAIGGIENVYSQANPGYMGRKSLVQIESFHPNYVKDFYFWG